MDAAALGGSLWPSGGGASTRAAWLGAQIDGDTAHALSLKRGHQHVAQFLEAAAQSQSAAAATATATQTGVCAACGVSSSSGAHFEKCSRCKAVQYYCKQGLSAHALAGSPQVELRGVNGGHGQLHLCVADTQ